MSAVGHAITLTSPIRVQDVRKNGLFFGHAVKGTPADCVKIAVQELLDSPPDVVLSGINVGANVGVNILYSGTVSAATEGAFLGIRSAAISLATLKDPDFRFAARIDDPVLAAVVDVEVFVQRQVVTVGIQAFLVEGIDRDFPIVHLAAYFGTGENHDENGALASPG